MKSHTTLKALVFVIVLTLGLLIVAPGRLPRMFATEAAVMLAPLATITVNSTADGAPANNGACTLREALMNANGANQSVSTDCAAGGTTTNTITFNLPAGPQTVNLTGALPDITRSLTITGPGAGLLNVRRDTGGDYRIFNVPNGGLNIAFSGLTISNGRINSILAVHIKKSIRLDFTCS
jgi:CSLREA domain-containing protein